jgi:hypothetical protein
VHLRGTATKSGTGSTLIIADTAFPAILRAKYTGRETIGSCHAFTTVDFVGVMIHYSGDNNFYLTFSSNIADTTTINDFSFTMSYEI